MQTLLRGASAKSVLVVEDDADIRETLESLLEGEGYSVRTCANGLEALERLRGGEHVDVILLDLMMPVMDGWQFRVQQKRDPRLASIPVLAISADTTSKAAAIDADAYLKKPVDYDALIAAVERALLSMERKKLQSTLAETERLASLGTLAAGVAHEINNPLAFVVANLAYVAQTFGGGAPTADEAIQIRQAIDEARDGCNRIRSIVRDLQLFSRSPEDEHAAVDVRSVLDSSANIVMNEIRSRASLVKDYGAVPPVDANPGQLGQVFLNLVLNAAQAIPVGDASKHEIRLVARAQGSSVMVEVRDTGPGIPPEIRARIFDPFFTTKPVGVGTGLGLSIAHRIVSASGGDLSVESELGRGTTFRVRLPVSAGATASSKRLERAVPPAARRRAKILVLDDEEMIGLVLARVLGQVHDLEASTHPDEIIARVRAGARFDLILCDLMMPERSGMDVYEAIRAVDPAQAERMIFLTGGAFSARAQEFLSARTNAVVEKPFVAEELLERIDSVLGRLETATPLAG